jgi:hypothetical protein
MAKLAKHLLNAYKRITRKTETDSLTSQEVPVNTHQQASENTTAIEPTTVTPPKPATKPETEAKTTEPETAAVTEPEVAVTTETEPATEEPAEVTEPVTDPEESKVTEAETVAEPATVSPPQRPATPEAVSPARSANEKVGGSVMATATKTRKPRTPKGNATAPRRQMGNTREVLANPFKVGESVTIPAGTTFTSSNPTQKGRQVAKRGHKVTVSDTIPARIAPRKSEKGSKVLVRPLRIRAKGSGGYWKDITLTEKLIRVNGKVPTYETISLSDVAPDAEETSAEDAVVE